MQKNISSQRIYVYAHDISTDTPKTGDAANISAQLSKDAGASAATNDVAPTELDAVDQPGLYYFDMLQAETNAEEIALTAVSSTANVQLDRVIIYTRPANFPDLGIETDGDLTKVNLLDGHTPQTADNDTKISDIQGRLPAALVGGLMPSDVTAVSTDTAAADNLELQYNGAGITGDQFPSTQLQVGGLAVGAGGISLQAESYVLTTGTQSSGTISDAETVDGVTHQHTDTAGVMELYYQFDVGGNGIGAAADIHGRLDGNNDDLTVYAYNWDGASWDAIGDFSGQASSTNITREYVITRRNTGTGANLGKVRIRLYAASGLTSATLHIDRIIVSKSVVTESVGYANGAAWLDTVNGVAGTTSFVNGVADNHSLTIADTLTILSNVGLKDIHVINGSTVALGATVDNRSFFGDNWILDLDGRSVANTYFQGAAVSGVSTSATEVHFEGCDFASASIQLGHFDFCSFDGTITHTLAGDYNYHNCYSKVAGAGAPTFAKTSGQTITGQWRWWSGSMTLTGIEAGDVFTISGEMGAITLEGAEGTVEIRGTYKAIVDNRTGSPTLNLDGAIKGVDVASILADTNELQSDDIPGVIAALNDLSAADVAGELATFWTSPANLVDLVWDELQAGHTTAGSFGKYLDSEISGISTETTWAS